MLNLSMAEITVIAVVALLVLGPERLPVAIRKITALVRRSRTEFDLLKQGLQNDLNLKDELSQLRTEIATLKQDGLTIKQELSGTEQALSQQLTDLTASVAEQTLPLTQELQFTVHSSISEIDDTLTDRSTHSTTK